MKERQFILIYGVVMIVACIGCLYTLYGISSVEDRPYYSDYLLIITSIWYMMTGVGILLKKRWDITFSK